MSTHVPEFISVIFRYFSHYFVLTKLATSSRRVKNDSNDTLMSKPLISKHDNLTVQI